MTIYDKIQKQQHVLNLIFGEKDLIEQLSMAKKVFRLLRIMVAIEMVDYIFDISQTVSRNREVNKVDLWQFDRDKYGFVFK